MDKLAKEWDMAIVDLLRRLRAPRFREFVPCDWRVNEHFLLLVCPHLGVLPEYLSAPSRKYWPAIKRDHDNRVAKGVKESLWTG